MTAHTIARLNGSHPDDALPPLNGHPLFRQASIAAHTGDYERAIEYACDILPQLRTHPEDCARLYRYLIQWAVALGNLAQARFYASQAVRELKATLGPTHELTLTLRSSELFWMCESGMSDIAQRRFPDLIRDVEAHLDARHELRWAVLMNAVIPLKQQGHFALAATRYERIVRSMRRRPPEDPVIFFLARDNYAEVLAYAGDYEQSLAHYLSLRADITEAYGPDDVRTLKLRYRIAGVLYEAGRLDEAWKEWNALLPRFEEVCGPEHPESRRLRTLILLHCLEEGMDDEALSHAEALLAHYAQSESDDEMGADAEEVAMIKGIIAELRGESPADEAEGDKEFAIYEPGESFFAPESCPCALCRGEDALPTAIAS